MLSTVSQILRMPRVSIDLMARATAGNDPFYGRIVREFYREAVGPHPRLRMIDALHWGVALTLLPRRFNDYFMRIEASARRNLKKAVRSGYEFRRIEFNRHLADIGAIRASTPIRQGRVPDAFLHGEVRPCNNPPSRSKTHDYVYYGVFKGDRLVAYAGCAVYGELAMIEHIYGHADEQEWGVTPMLVMKMAESIIRDYPTVRYYGYGTFFGAGTTLRRFKRKLGFMPHRVDWMLDGDPAARQLQFVFRKVCVPGTRLAESGNARFVYIDNPVSVWRYRTLLRRCWGWGGLLKAAAKTATGRRALYAMHAGERLLHTGWLTFGFCRYYAVEPRAVVVGPVRTDPAARGQGLATEALDRVMRQIQRCSRSIVYIDTTPDNQACLKVIHKCGFGPPIGEVRKKKLKS